MFIVDEDLTQSLCGTHFPFTKDILWAIDPLLITVLQYAHRFTCCKPPFPFTQTSLPDSSWRTRNRHRSGSKPVEFFSDSKPDVCDNLYVMIVFDEGK